MLQKRYVLSPSLKHSTSTIIYFYMPGCFMASLYDMFGIINQLIGTWNKKARELGNAWKQNDFNFNTCARFQGFHVVFTFTIIQMVAGFSCSYMVCRFQVLSLFLVFQSVQSVQQEKVTDNVFVAFIAFLPVELLSS